MGSMSEFRRAVAWRFKHLFQVTSEDDVSKDPDPYYMRIADEVIRQMLWANQVGLSGGMYETDELTEPLAPPDWKP
jgi:hypothetical protein